MKEDSIIASAIDMWTEDALQRDPQTKEIFQVEINTTDDYAETKLSKGLALELDRFLKEDLRIEKQLTPILKRILLYGNCPVKLDFSDKLSDEKLELKESEMKTFELISDKVSQIYGYTENSIDKPEKSIDDKSRLNEECFTVDWEKYGEDYIDMDHTIFKNIRTKLNEDYLLDTKPMLKGRWYIELIGHGTNIYELTSKQKLIAYMDRDYPDKFISPKRIINFSNNTGKHSVTFEIGDRNINLSKKQYYRLERGESFIENTMVAWQVLSALEDILILTRMTRSILYRIFSVEVGNKGNTETSNLLNRLKNKIKMDETVDIRSKIYNSNLKQVPLGDSIFIPTRNGIGVIDVKTVGGDVNLKDAVDLDYFKDKVFAGLRIPAPFLGFTESLPGGIGDTSLTRMDIRYSRTITRIQSILSEGLKDLCLLYLKFTRTEKALEELPDFKIVFTSVNSAEDMSRAEFKQKQMDTLKNVLSSLKELGIDISANSEGYEKTRQQLIKEYFGSVLLDRILKDEAAMVVSEPTEGQKGALDSEPNDDMGGDFGGGSPSDIISGPNLEEPIENEEEPTGNTEPEENEENTEIGNEENTTRELS